ETEAYEHSPSKGSDFAHNLYATHQMLINTHFELKEYRKVVEAVRSSIKLKPPNNDKHRDAVRDLWDAYRLDEAKQLLPAIVALLDEAFQNKDLEVQGVANLREFSSFLDLAEVRKVIKKHQK